MMIAVLFNKEGLLANFYNVEKFVIYSKSDSFDIIKVIKDFKIEKNDINLFRKSLEDLLEKLGDCRILLGNQIIGVPFYFFDQKGFKVCEADLFSEVVIQEIHKDYIEKANKNENDEKLKMKNEKIPLAPFPLDEAGNYFFDFIKLQKYRPDISSKKVLIPFFTTELFQTITIYASHIMPWLDTFLKQSNLGMTTEREGGKYIIIIYHKVCS